ncbi:MAG: aspartate 1-decarboxylase [candidate division WOR-3 bacterium]
MMRTMVKSKIQRLTITDKNLKYQGSLELDSALLRAADILPNEMVQVVNLNNGARFETYIMAAPAGSGKCVLNGAAARLGEVGDEVIVMSTVLVDERVAHNHRIIKVTVDHNNRIIRDNQRRCH